MEHVLVLARPARRRPSSRTVRIDLVDGVLDLTCRTRGAWAALTLLMRRGASVTALATTAGPPASAARREWQTLARTLARHGAMGHRWRLDGALVVAVQPITSIARRPWRPTPPRGRVVLSRFAHLRRDGSAWWLCSPLADDRLIAGDVLLRLLPTLAAPATARERAAQAGLSLDVVQTLLGVLHASGMLTAVARDGRPRDTVDPTLAPWEFGDLVLQAQHRGGRHDGVVGATYEFADIMPPEPATVRLPARRRTPLPPVRTADLVARDAPFAAIMEARTSVRAHGATPITREQVSELLWRSARVRAVYPQRPDRPYAVTDRPHPSGGACYPLEVMLVVGRCRGLSPGLYHYEPVEHALAHLGRHRETVDWLLRDARHAQGRTDDAQLLLVFVARFRRVTWKYRSIALATILKDVGALMQTLYLNATAMGLAPCAVGSGDAARLGAALGWPLHEAASVGELLIGTRPD